MVIKENSWIGINQKDMVVQDPSCDKIIMVMMFLVFVPYIHTPLSS